MWISEMTKQRIQRAHELVLIRVAVLCMTFEAPAQMLPFVPDPVTTPELVDYADTLGLSDGQRLALLEFHDVYRQEFRALEDEQVKAFIEDLIGLARNFTQEGFRIPERSEFEKLIERYDEIVTKAKGFDRRLFDGVATILTEGQLTTLPSIRIKRELDIYLQLMDGPAQLNPGAPVVLSSLVRELELSAEEIALTEEPLRQYEGKAIRRARKLYRQLKDAATLALDTIDRIGVRNMEPMEMMQLGQDEAFEGDMRATFDDGSKPLQAELFAASQQNLRLLRQLTPLLSTKNVESLREAYYRIAFRRVYRRPSSWREAYARAIALESVDDERRGLIESQRGQLCGEEDQLIDGIVQRIEASREYRTTQQLDGERGELEERIAAYRQRRERVGESAMTALTSILTPEELAAIESADDEHEHTTGLIAVAGAPGGGRTAATESTDQESAGASDANAARLRVPAALSIARRDQLTALIDLDDGQPELVEALYTDYRAEYEDTLKQMLQEDEQAEEADDDEKPDAVARAKQRVARMATLASVDENLFEFMELVFESEAAHAAVATGRDLRARERAMSAAKLSSFVFGREESFVDLVGVALAMEQSVEIVAGTKPIIERYGEMVGPIADERLKASRDVRRWMRVLSEAESRGIDGNLVTRGLTNNLTDARRKVRVLDGRIRYRNRQLLLEMEQALDDELGWMLRVAFQREAFPEIYADELGLDEKLRTVRGLDDLSAQQREQTEEVAVRYRSAFSQLSERMVQLRRQRDFDITAMQMPSREVIEGEIELERLRFDRHEAQSRAILRLRLILTESQIVASGLHELRMDDRRSAFQ